MTTIAKLYEMQKALDANIIEKKGLEGKDLLPNTILALQVELGECANEWRGFKHWSNDQEPRTKKTRQGKTATGQPARHFDEYNPLLEEYVDCLHFFLSIARQLELPPEHLDTPAYAEGFTTKVFTEVITTVGLIDVDPAAFFDAWDAFRHLGKMLGFPWEDIAAAYVSKNEVNHQRQATGY